MHHSHCVKNGSALTRALCTDTIYLLAIEQIIFCFYSNFSRFGLTTFKVKIRLRFTTSLSPALTWVGQNNTEPIIIFSVPLRLPKCCLLDRGMSNRYLGTHARPEIRGQIGCLVVKMRVAPGSVRKFSPVGRAWVPPGRGPGPGHTSPWAK